jgi:hypothetical protein
MTAFKCLGAAAILFAATAPAPAQQVISEPGYCAFFYPNANCQNKGPGNPYTDSNAQRSMAPGSQIVGVSPGSQTVGVAPAKRPRKPATRPQ